MNFSQKNTISFEISSDCPLSKETQAYLDARAKNAFYDYIYEKFRAAESAGLTKAKLARRLNKKQDQISHLLGSPGNWTISTIALLLAGICREEIVPYSTKFMGKLPRNNRAVDLLPTLNPLIVQIQPPEPNSLPPVTLSGKKSEYVVNI